ncbi:hypothetical protein PPYR_06970 [Photinus pyralis]|uniref:Cytochrome P450 n=1 Tax=Photinus pyralis TaxID=7054 RepID=A0A5N4AP38_PHOPY|nr:probable cytochrome P450 301a1, mitochondrial [Photinus pyralis]KAB0799090.1 hypothetical protein PPYR_06970 [Photinus pyralis]
MQFSRIGRFKPIFLRNRLHNNHYVTNTKPELADGNPRTTPQEVIAPKISTVNPRNEQPRLIDVGFNTSPLTNKNVDPFHHVVNLDSVPKYDPSQYLSFDAMPGPKLVRYCAKLWNIIPLTRNQDRSIKQVLRADYLYGYLNWYNSIPLFKRMVQEYGAVLRIQGPFGGDLVIMLLLEDAIKLSQKEGPHPIRFCFHSLRHYRLKNKQYQHPGPFFSCGVEWKKMRDILDGTLQVVVPRQIATVKNASKEFVQRIAQIRNRQDEVPITFNTEIDKWSLECVCALLFNKRCGFLETSSLSASSESDRILGAVTGLIDAIRRCEFGVPLWKLMGTPAWKKLVMHSDTLESAVNKYVSKAKESLRQTKPAPEKESFLEMLLTNENVSTENALTTLLDMLLIGVHSLSHAVGFLLYHLSINPNVQKKLYKEVCAEEDLQKMSFMRVCIRESLRLKQPIPVLNRVLAKDTIIRNYYVPKGTSVLISTQLYGIKQEYFENALQFKPDRWLNDEMKLGGYDLNSLPYGVGGRACFAQQLVEMQLSSLLAEIIRKYRVEYHYGVIKSTSTMLAAPNGPLRFTFIDRE